MRQEEIRYELLKLIDQDTTLDQRGLAKAMGVSLEEESNLISLYPNPTNGSLTFVGLDETQNYIFQVYSTLGVLLEKNMELKANETIQLAYPKGYYILQVLNTNSKERFNYSVLIE